MSPKPTLPSAKSAVGSHPEAPVSELGQSASRSLRAAEQREEGDQAERAGVGRHEVDPRGAPHFVAILLGGDQEEGGQRHQLPGDEEHDRVAGQHDGHHRGRHDPPPQAQPAPAVAMLLRAPVAGAVDGAERGDQEHRYEEESRQAVEVEGGAADRQGADQDGLRPARAPVEDETRAADGRADRLSAVAVRCPAPVADPRTQPGTPLSPMQAAASSSIATGSEAAVIALQASRPSSPSEEPHQELGEAGTARRAGCRASAGRTAGTAGCGPAGPRGAAEAPAEPAQSGTSTPSRTCSGT